MIRLYKNNVPFEWQKYEKGRFILPSLPSMEQSYITPFASDWFSNGTYTITAIKIFKYKEFELSRADISSDMTNFRDGGAVFTLPINLEVRGSYARWTMKGTFVEEFDTGVYAIEFTDSKGDTFTTELFRNCGLPLIKENFLLIEEGFPDGLLLLEEGGAMLIEDEN